MTKAQHPLEETLGATTNIVAATARAVTPERVPVLTVLAHVDTSRVGERARLRALDAGETVSISRTAPNFEQASAGRPSPRPIADRSVSRSPALTLAMRDGAIVLATSRGVDGPRIDGTPLAGSRTLAQAELERGVVIEISGGCALLLHLADAVRRAGPALDLVGDSDALHRLRRDIARVAASDLRVLLRGETGSGKELAARAIHQASGRAKGPCVCVNMAAVQPSLASSALFGHVRGAFSGAVADHDGHFAAAHGGTLFLDEIGDTDLDVQAMLLRAIETSKVQRVGDRRVQDVDVRLLAATDADLDAAIAAGRFREPLRHRLGEFVLRVPPLRERRDDIGRLVVHFVRELLNADDCARLLDPAAERPWLAPALVARLARADWPGNVRQLRNVVRQLVVLGTEEPVLTVDAELEAALEGGRRSAPPASAPTSAGVVVAPDPPTASGKGGRRAQDITDAELVAALEQTGYRRAAAAARLGIARSTLYALMERSPGVRKGAELTRAQVEAALDKRGPDIAGAAAELQVSEHGLKLRMQALGMR